MEENRERRKRRVNPVTASELKTKQGEIMRKTWKILFNDQFFPGGAGGNFKAAAQQKKPVTFDKVTEIEKVKNKTAGICGKVCSHIIVLDYDDDQSFSTRLKIAKAKQEHCIAIQSTNRGGHFYWFNSENNPITKQNNCKKSLLTLNPVDYHSPIKLIRDGSPVFYNSHISDCISNNDGTIRDIVYFNVNEDESLDELPFYDRFFEKANDYDFLNMADGDGRNDTLFRFAGVLKNAGYNYDQYKTIAGLINDFLFNIPLDPAELEAVTRTEGWENLKIDSTTEFFTERGKFLHDHFGDYLKDNFYITKINGQLYIYKDGVYVGDDQEIERAEIKVMSNITDSRRKEVIKYLQLVTEEQGNDKGNFLHLIPFKNGVYDLNTDTLKDFRPEYIITNKIPWNYNPHANCEAVGEILDRVSNHNPDIRKCLEEIAGACLFRSATLGGGMAAVLIGDKHNGKSTYIHLLESMLGCENYSAVDLGNLEKRFLNSDIIGKIANLGDDISNIYIKDNAVIKKMITGETIQVERKGKDPVNVTPYAMHVFCANEMPHTKDGTGALLRRLLFVPFEANFTPLLPNGEPNPDYDPQIQYKLRTEEAVETFILLALHGLKRLLKNKKYTYVQAAEEIKEEYRIDNDSVLSFISDQGKEAIENESTEDVYKRYQVFCAGNGLQPYTKSKLSRKVKQELNLQAKPSRINGKTIRIFVEN